MNHIDISNACIRCGKCVTVCPARVLASEVGTKNVLVEAIDHCIACGQCAAVCPTGALHHSEYPASAVHRVDSKMLPTPDQVMLLIKKRRSNRTFTDRLPSDDAVNKILEAAKAAPTAENSMDMQFVVVKSSENVRKLIDFVVETYRMALDKFEAAGVSEDHAMASMRHVVKSVLNGRDVVLRNAGEVILFVTRTNGMFNIADANLAYQNASLMAESLGVSQVYLGYLCSAIKGRPGELESLLGINGHIQAAMAIGHASITFPNYIDRPMPEVIHL